MRQSIIGAGAAALLTLAACGDGEREAASIEAADDNHADRLQTMDEDQRNATFIRAIRDAGLNCQGVESSTYQGRQNGAPTWSARCSDDTEWIIILGNDGAAQVVNAEELRRARPAAR